MTLDKKVNQVLKERPDITSHLNAYARTGYKLHEQIFLSEVELVRKLYGRSVYDKFMHVYDGIRGANDYE